MFSIYIPFNHRVASQDHRIEIILAKKDGTIVKEPITDCFPPMYSTSLGRSRGWSDEDYWKDRELNDYPLKIIRL